MLFSTVAAPFHVPTKVNKDSNFSTSSPMSGEGGLQTRGLCVHSVLADEGACRPGDACLRTAPTPRAGPDVLRRMNHCACPDGPLEPNFVAPKPPQMLTLGIGSSCWLGSKE